jgi:hypothetical protein
MDNRYHLGSFDGITDAIEHLMSEVATGEADNDTLKMSIMLIEQARETLADKAKHQGVLSTLQADSSDEPPRRAATGSPFRPSALSVLTRHNE